MSLLLDLAPIRLKIGSSVTFSMHSKRMDLLPSNWKLVNGIKVSGFFIPEKHEMRMIGTIECILNTECSRCLEKIEKIVQVNFDEKLLFTGDIPYLDRNLELEDLEEEYWIYDKIDYDFEPMIVDEILQVLPMQIICKDTCRGLCEKCGENLNEKTCKCRHNEVDPRWAKLAQLQDREV